MTVDVVCVGAHPDDVEIGMGGTVACMVRDGLRVAIVDLTDGEPTPAGSPEIRAREAAAAGEVLGVHERRVLSLRNRELADTVAARKELATALRELRPRVLFAPYPVDAHPDHVAAAALCDAARFYAKFVKTDMPGQPVYPARLYRYFAMHLRSLPRPSFVVDVSAGLEAKLKALDRYESQFGSSTRNAGLLDTVAGQARYWGSLIGKDAGEPFHSPEEVGVRSVADLL